MPTMIIDSLVKFMVTKLCAIEIFVESAMYLFNQFQPDTAARLLNVDLWMDVIIII